MIQGEHLATIVVAVVTTIGLIIVEMLRRKGKADAKKEAEPVSNPESVEHARTRDLIHNQTDEMRNHFRELKDALIPPAWVESLRRIDEGGK